MKKLEREKEFCETNVACKGNESNLTECGPRPTVTDYCTNRGNDVLVHTCIKKEAVNIECKIYTYVAAFPTLAREVT